MNKCCHHCTDRKPGCHDTCEKYKRELAVTEILRIQRFRKRVANEYHKDAIEKQRRAAR